MAHYLNGNDNQKPNGDDKIVVMPTLAERDKMRREKEKLERKMTAAAEPMINMPPVTKYMIGLMLVTFIATGVALPADQADAIISNYGFVPEKFNEGDFTLPTLLSPITHMFLHGGWMHIVMNLFMLAAFGSGIERWLGSKRMLILFFASGLFGVATHYILNTTSPFPMIGASGGLSGFFAGAIVMLNRGQREMGGRIGILPFALLWIGLSIGFGMLGGPDGSSIAWAAHVGGFLGGFLVLKAMRV
jgi:membrane associated rhomboid family serine protease